MQVKPTISGINRLKRWTKLVYRSDCPRIVYAIGCTTSLIVMMSTNCAVFAQSSGISSTPEICDVDLTLLKPTEVGTDPNIITADTVSPKGTTIPSLWWTNEQIPSKLVNNWIANRRQSQIYLLVNTQYWNILDYVDRYRTIDRFGRVAQSYGYNLQLCNSQKSVLARYTCDAIGNSIAQKSSNTTKPPQNCRIWLNGTDQNGMGVKNK